MEDKKQYWLTPPELYTALDKEFHFDFDPCPYPYEGVCATQVNWGKSNYVNPPFRKSDGQNGIGPTAIIRKAVEENKKRKDVVIVMNTMSFINILLEAGAEVRSLGRVRWIDAQTGKAWTHPSNTSCFILRGNKFNA